MQYHLSYAKASSGWMKLQFSKGQNIVLDATCCPDYNIKVEPVYSNKGVSMPARGVAVSPEVVE